MEISKEKSDRKFRRLPHCATCIQIRLFGRYQHRWKSPKKNQIGNLGDFLTARRAFRSDFSDATNTDGNLQRKISPALSRKDHCSSTSSMEHFEVSPDAERHGGFSILRKLVATEWRRRLRHSRARLFLCELRTTCVCPPSISSTPLRTNWRWSANTPPPTKWKLFVSTRIMGEVV